MTIRKKLESMLVRMGMFDSQAEKVIDLAIPELNDIVGNYSINFEDDSDAYPDAIYSVLMLSVKPIALKWIEENHPMAWFKLMFA